MNSDIETIRRFTIAACSLLFAFFAINSIASSAPLKVERSSYKVEITGIHVHDWHDQSASYPSSKDPWTTERGTVTYGFSTPRAYRFSGTRFIGKAPGVDLPGFQWYPAIGSPSFRFKGAYQQKFKRRQNFVAYCGGELGECDGSEKSGVETTSRSCRKLDQKAPFSLETGEGTRAALTLGSVGSMSDFCGAKYPAFNSVTRLPKFFIKSGLDDIAELGKGRHRTWRASKEVGSSDVYPFDLKKCPPLSGPGHQDCWTTEVRMEITRLR